MMLMDARRRQVLQGILAAGCAGCAAGFGFLRPGAGGEALAQDQALGPSLGGPSLAGPEASDLPLHPARWWKDAGEGRVECGLCNRKCRVADLERGACGVRENHGGKYFTLVHSRPCSIHVDPIEKKPFNHVLPGTDSLSLATPGCNYQCRFCQNWEIAQARPEQVPTMVLGPDEIVALAVRQRTPTIACTYTEPVVYAEYVYDIAAAGKKAGVRTIMVSNGSLLEEPLNDLCEVLAAVKVDLKAYTEKFYKEVCSGELKPVLDTLRRLHKKGVWTEIVVLVIPTLNDSDKEFRDMARFIRNDMGPEVPIHYTRFHPSYRIQNLPRTPVATLERARDIAMAEGLQYAYLGNVPGHPGNHTYCPKCKAVVIRRMGLALEENLLDAGRCPKCRTAIPGIWT
jgi:pyruvate formate lyase activating enzyme